MPIFPVDPSLQATVSGQFAQPRKGESFGEILDMILATKAQGQQQALDVFAAITRGNPALASLIASQPGFMEAATGQPSLRRGAPDLGAQIGQHVQRGAAKFAAQGEPRKPIPAEARAKALEFFDPAERNTANAEAYLTFIAPDATPEESQRAYEHLNKNAPESLKAAALTEGMKGKVELARELVKQGLFTTEADAMKKVLTAKDEEYRQLQMLSIRTNIALATINLARAQEDWANRGLLDEPRIVQLEEEQRQAQAALGTLEQEDALFGTMTKGAVPTPEEERIQKERDAMKSDLRRMIADRAEMIKASREAQRKKRGSGKPEAGGETPEQRKARLKELYNKSRQ